MNIIISNELFLTTSKYLLIYFGFESNEFGRIFMRAFHILSFF